jgi:hypothetical protein
LGQGIAPEMYFLEVDLLLLATLFNINSTDKQLLANLRNVFQRLLYAKVENKFQVIELAIQKQTGLYLFSK